MAEAGFVVGRRRRVLGVVAAVAALTVGSGLTAGPAVAAEPMRVSDTTDLVVVDAVDGDRALEVSVQRSAVLGAYASASLYAGPNGDKAGSGTGTSEWTDDTFRATVELLDDDGRGVGTVVVSGRHTPVGEAQREVQRFNDGNVHVVMDHSTTSLAVTDVHVSLDGDGFEVERVVGHHETGSLFVTQPATSVGRSEQVVVSEPVTENVADFFIETEHGLDEAGVDLRYADSPLRASGGLDLSRRNWDGTLGLYTEEGEQVGRVAAAATVTEKGRTVRLFERDRGGYVGWTYTPYRLELTVDGPVSPARITAVLATVRYSWHTSPLDAAAG